jgi:4-aminobutyrate aminotransferase-like enzyme
MPKLTIAEVQEALARSNVEPKQQESVLNHLQEVIKELEDEKEQQNPTVKVKNEFGVIILDENGDIKVDTAALIYQIKVGEDHGTVFQRIRDAVKEFNLTKKGLKHPVKSVTEAFQAIAPKIFKNQGIIRKTKEITRVLKTNNKI